MRLSEEELTRELRAMRPEIDPEFGAKLDAWAADDFPAMGESPAPAKLRRSRPFRLRPTLPRLVFAACMILIVGTVSVGVVSQNMGSDESGGLSSDDSGLDSGPANSTFEGEGGAAEPSTGSGPPGLAEAPIGQGRATDDASVAAPDSVPPRQDQLKPGQEREVERKASMELSTDPEQVDDVADGVVEVTERYDGIVVSSNVNSGDERGRANFDLRIPAQNLQATLADLSDLASVSERNEGTLDVTAPFISAQERFADAKVEVDALIDELGEADSADEIAQIREQLRVARGELSVARSELAGLKQRTDFSRLAVTVVGDGDADGWSFGDAVDDAGSVLEDLAGALLVALAVIVPLGLIAAALWFGIGSARRRSRERALDD